MSNPKGLWSVLLLLTMGCAQLPSDSDGVVALEVTIPASLTLAQGSSVQLEARALNLSGEVVQAEITWITSDTTITVDPTTGIVTAIDDAGLGRVQAEIGNLHSNILTFNLIPVADPTQT